MKEAINKKLEIDERESEPLIATAQPPELPLVKPTRALFFASGRCEKRAAAIANKSLVAINDKNTTEVMYRFLQNKQGQYESLAELTGYAYAAFIFLIISFIFYVIEPYFIISNKNTKLTFGLTFGGLGMLFSGFSLVTCLPKILADCQNVERYGAIKDQCQSYLTDTLSPSELREIKALGYSHAGLTALQGFIARKDLPKPTVNLEEKIAKLKK